MQVCRNCGRGPAAKLVIRRHVGMLIMQRFVRLEAPLCRDCGMRITKSYTKRTAVEGWWGIISFFVNWVTLGLNLRAYRKASSLPEPTAAHDWHDRQAA
jgi:hypothetical protein